MNETDQHSHDLSGGGYVDIRKHSDAREFRRCPECGHEWLHERWRRDGDWKEAARTSNCPNCRLVPLLDRLAPEYASHVVELEPEDPGIRPSGTLRYVGKAMAYEASERVGYTVNSLSCESYIKIHLPDCHWLHRDEHPSQRYDSGRINEEYVREVRDE
jgi:ssDNA-binding Zn-finger/Zn-ribbon topoisomerase 1